MKLVGASCCLQGRIALNRNARSIFTTASKMDAESPAKFLVLDGMRKIAYRQHVGTKSPGVVFLCGFMSNMQGAKAKFLHKFCVENGNSFLRFDYEGVGESPGRFRDVHLGIWKENVLAALDKLTTGPQLIVGSSMGAWLMFLMALERKQRLHSLCGISSAVNFTDRIFQSFPKEVRDKISAGEEVIIPGPFGDYPVTKKFLDESSKCFLPMDSSIPIQCPVRLMHSIHDKDSPFETSTTLAKLLETKDVEVFLRKNANHQMSDDSSLALLESIIKELLAKLN